MPSGASGEYVPTFFPFAAFIRSMMEVNAADLHVLIRVARKVEMARDWFRNVLIIITNV